MKANFSAYPLVITLVMCCISFSLQAQEVPFEGLSIPISVKEATVEPTLGPITEISFTETTFDFGTVEEGTIVTHVFTLTNTGQEPLVLTDAKGSCGCTIPQWPREPLAPGETASITVEFNSKNKMGKRNQRVTVTANTDPAQSFIYLTGEVTPRSDVDFTISPSTDELEEDASQVEAIDPDCFAIYPNPTAELLRLDMEGNIGATATISIFSKTGQLMAERKIDRVEGTIEFQVGHYPAGLYIAHVKMEGKQMQPRCFVVVD
ncbi:DUF1573 domain-containing protein [Lewinella sp. LCG006]|uniref:DUF1573 domain-containing protein n=1 Tax=Lewinella sp. LCG006 TaxID=3231911 RepID=UPI00345FF5AE